MMASPNKTLPVSPELVMGALLTVFGGMELWQASKLSLSEDFTLGPGALPVIYAIGVIGFSVALVYDALRKEQAADESGRGFDLRKGGLFLGSLAVYLVLIPLIGFLLSSLIFSLAFCYLVCGLSWQGTLLFGIPWAVGVYVVFADVLEVPLETGLLFPNGFGG